MSDGLDLGQHGGQVAAGGAAFAATVTAALARIFSSRDAARREEAAAERAAKVDTRLALIEQRLGDLMHSLEKLGALGERIALLERDVKALHERMDGRSTRRQK